MSKRKGLSLEDKRSKLMEIFHESRDFFQLKDLEKLGPKKKGIVAQSVKEVLDSLVADNMVTAEKIGVSNYFWAFPSAAGLQRRRRLDDLQAELDQLKQQYSDLEKRITQANTGREDSKQREQQLIELMKAEGVKTSLEHELQKYSDNNPAVLDTLREAQRIALSAANRWTENIMALEGFCSSKFGISNDDFRRQFEIPEDFDTIDPKSFSLL